MFHSYSSHFHSVYSMKCLDIIRVRSNHSFSTQYTRSVVAKYHRINCYQLFLSRREACVLLQVMSRSDKLANLHPKITAQITNVVRLAWRLGADFQLFFSFFTTILQFYSIFYLILSYSL